MTWLRTVSQACNSSYLEGVDRDSHGSRAGPCPTGPLKPSLSHCPKVWMWTEHPASASQGLGLQVCTIMAGFVFLHIFFFLLNESSVPICIFNIG
jgi:hypothetical protein